MFQIGELSEPPPLSPLLLLCQGFNETLKKADMLLNR